MERQSWLVEQPKQSFWRVETSGNWICRSYSVAPERKEDSVDEALETYKYFLEWAGKDSNDLILKKIVLMKPFLKKDGSKRQSWMSSLIFDDDPRLKFKNK